MSEDTIEVPTAKQRKGRLINVRVSDAEYSAIEEAAKSAGMSVSAFFRSLLLEGAGVRPILTAEDRLIMAALLEDMRMPPRNFGLIFPDQACSCWDQDTPPIEGVDILGCDGPHLARKVADDRRFQDAGDQRALWDHGVDALDLSGLGGTVTDRTR